MEKFKLCACGDEPLNSGTPNCVPSASRTSYLILVSTFDNDGNENKIAAGDVLDAAYFEGKINEPDKSKRWYILPKTSNIEEARAEANTFDVDGIAKIIDQNIRTFLGNVYGAKASPRMAAVINSRACSENSVYEITVDGEIRGENDGQGGLLPIKIEDETLYARYDKPTKTQKQTVIITFTVEENVRDENLAYIEASDIGIDVRKLRSVVDVFGEVTPGTISTTGVEFDLGYEFSSLRSLNPLVGIVAADLSYDEGVTPSTVFNITQSSSLAVATLDETSNGHYVLTHAAQTSGDVIEVKLSKNGVELKPFTYQIP